MCFPGKIVPPFGDLRNGDRCIPHSRCSEHWSRWFESMESTRSHSTCLSILRSSTNFFEPDLAHSPDSNSSSVSRSHPLVSSNLNLSLSFFPAGIPHILIGRYGASEFPDSFLFGVNPSISPFTSNCLINRNRFLINLSSKRKRREWCPISLVKCSAFLTCLVWLLSLIQFGAYPIGSYSDVWFPFATYYVCTFYIYIYTLLLFSG